MWRATKIRAFQETTVKLRYSSTSPFVRKVSVTALEKGLAERIERVPTNPWDPATDLSTDNPLAKVPALLLDDGTALYDSVVICEYLDSLAESPRLFPVPGPYRWDALRRHALANGMLEAAVLAFQERRMRPQEIRWSDFIDLQIGTLSRALDVAEMEAPALRGRLDIGTLTLACALDYADFRLPDVNWRNGRPALLAWHQSFSERPSLRETMPHDPVD
jgi:glutathione S-transferase